MISVLSIGYLYWSSSWQWQAHIRGCKLLRPLPRAEMSDFGPVFHKMYFLWVWLSPKKLLVQFFWVLPPKTGYFAQPSETSLPLCGNWGSTETTININDRLIFQFLGTTPISAKWNSATPIPAKWPYPPKKTHLCGNLCGKFWWNFFRSPRTLGQRSFWKKRHPIWSIFAPVAPFTICNPIYGLTTLYYISQPRSQMKYSAAMY